MTSHMGIPELSSSVSLVYASGRPSYHVLIKSSSRRNWILVGISPRTGELRFSFTKHKDIFNSEAEALEYLKSRCGPVEVLGTGKHVLGYVVIGSTALLLLAEKVRVSASLPGNHEIKAVSVSKWHKISLNGSQAPDAPSDTPSSASSPLSKEEQARGVEKITTFHIDGAHYFCETLDVSRPFPSTRPVNQPSWEFVWNRWLSTSWRSIGLDHICPPLLQGLYEARPLTDFEGSPYTLILASRRGRLHAGPRYKARGLNEQAEPGNEIECEQIVWKQVRAPFSHGPGSPLPPPSYLWSRYAWRRGSVPLWWGVKIKNQGMGEAEIKINPSCTFKGSRKYVRRLQKRFMPDPHLDPDDFVQPLELNPRSDSSLRVPLLLVSLLRKGTLDKDRSETKLASAFDGMVGALRKEHQMPLLYIALDWHEMDKALGHEGIVEAFWSQIRGVLPSHSFALGLITKIGPDHTDPSTLQIDDGSSHSPASGPFQRCITSAGKGWQARWLKQQRGLVRYNCADSLDRTNVSSFFGAVQVLAEQCREMDISVAHAPKGGVSPYMTKRGLSPPKSQPQPQPAGAAGRSSALGSFSLGTASMIARPVTPSGNANPSTTASVIQAVGGSMKGSTSAFEKLNKGFLSLMNDLKTPGRVSGSSQPAAPVNHPTSHHAASDSDYGIANESNKTSVKGEGSLGRSSAPMMGFNPIPQQLLLQPQPQPQPQAVQPPVVDAAALKYQELQALLHNLEAAGPLPQGWEAKIDRTSNRIFYVDHNAKTTSWERPPSTPPSQVTIPAPPVSLATTLTNQLNPATTKISNWLGPSSSAGTLNLLPSDQQAQQKEVWEPLKPWVMLGVDAKKFGRRMSSELLSASAELFLVNGDLSAWLYTGSQAMHSERILIFEPAESKLRKAGVGHYGGVIVGLKRRFNNVWVDSDKQMQMDMILGLKHQEYFPHTYLFYKEDATILLDYYPESDEEKDPVGKISWPKPDHAKPTMGTEAPGSAYKGGLHTRSYSSTELFAPQPNAYTNHHPSLGGAARPQEAGASQVRPIHHQHSDGILNNPPPSDHSPSRLPSQTRLSQASTASSPAHSNNRSCLLKTDSDVLMLTEAILGGECNSSAVASHHELLGLRLDDSSALFKVGYTSSMNGTEALDRSSVSIPSLHLPTSLLGKKVVSTGNLIDFEAGELQMGAGASNGKDC